MSQQLSKHKLLFMIPTLRGGGAERVITTLLKFVDRSRFKLYLAIVDTSQAIYLSDLPNDVELIDLQCSRVRYALPKIIKLIWKLRPNTVFSTLGHLNLALAMARPFLPNNVRYIARETTIVSHGIQNYRQPCLWAWLYRRFYKNHDLVICQSQAMQSDLVEQFSFPKNQSEVIYNPLDVEHIRIKASEPITCPATTPGTIKLIAAGRLCEVKGFDLLIDAIAQLADPCIHLTLLGTGPLENQLKKQAQQKGIAEQVYFAGFQPNPYAWMAKADAFVLSSRYEGFPNVVLEALACGIPIIATPAPGGLGEILKNLDGTFTIAEEISTDSLCKAIKKVRQIRRPSIDSVSFYRVDQIVEQYQKAIIRNETI